MSCLLNTSVLHNVTVPFTLQAKHHNTLSKKLKHVPTRRQHGQGCVGKVIETWSCSSLKRGESQGSNPSSESKPLLLKTLLGEKAHRVPVWMMRQAGRYMKVEISLQPYRAFKPDGVILFSDILTPLAAMNIPFDICPGKGPLIHTPIRTMEAVREITTLEAAEKLPFIIEILRRLREEVNDSATVLGFVGAPFTLASYIIEGGSSKNYVNLKSLMYTQPEVMHALLRVLTENLISYIRYQIDSGAQVIQIFDSWASELSPLDYEGFCLPYCKRIVKEVKKTHPNAPLILFVNGGGALLERMVQVGADVISVDHRVCMTDAISRMGTDLGYQGNVDPGILFGSRELIERRILDTLEKTRDVRHVLNLGHGVLVGTPEVNVAHFFEYAKSLSKNC